MQATYTYTRLLVPNFAVCFRFYRDVLGLAATFGDEQNTYADFATGTVTLALFDQAEMSQAVGGAAAAVPRADPDPVCLIFSVDNVDTAYAELQAQGVQFVAAPTDHPEWGLRTAHLRDPAGNLIELYEPRPYQPE